MDEEQRKKIFEGNNLIRDFLVKTKLNSVEQSVENLISKLESINHKLSMVEEHLDTHSIQKIYDFDDRISQLETFEDRLRDAL